VAEQPDSKHVALPTSALRRASHHRLQEPPKCAPVWSGFRRADFMASSCRYRTPRSPARLRGPPNVARRGLPAISARPTAAPPIAGLQKRTVSVGLHRVATLLRSVLLHKWHVTKWQAALMGLYWRVPKHRMCSPFPQKRTGATPPMTGRAAAQPLLGPHVADAARAGRKWVCISMRCDPMKQVALPLLRLLQLFLHKFLKALP
jgi:hypothetical protein